MAEWAQREGWVKYRSSKEIERQLEHDIRLEAQATEGAAFAKGLARSLRAATRRRRGSAREARPVASPANRGEPSTGHDLGDVQPVEQSPECQSSELQEAQVSSDRPRRPISANTTVPSETERPKPGRPKKKRKSAEILPFRAGQHTALATKPGTMLLPVRSKAERAKLRMDLAALRGLLLAQQVDLLDRHEQRLEDFGHLIGLYLAPHNYLVLDPLGESARAEKIIAVQKAALSQLLPTERDTLAGAVKTLTTALAVTIQIKLKVAELAREFIRNDEGGDHAGRTPINEFDTPTLRKVHEAMEALTRQRAKAAETAKPTATGANR